MPGKETAETAGTETAGTGNALPELSEEAFDGMLSELENAVYALDAEKMRDIVRRAENFRYHGEALAGALRPVWRKIEMCDYMSAMDAVSGIRERLKQKGGGGA